MCSESGLPDDLSWGRLGYIRWLDTAQDLCHIKTTHPLDHTDFTGPRLIRRRRRRGPKILQRRRRAPAPRRRKHPAVAAAAAARQRRRAPMPRALRPSTSSYARGEARLAELAPPSSQRESDDEKTSPRRRHRARR